MVLGILLACSFIEWRAGALVSSRWPAEQRRLLAITPVASVAALFVNPIGWRLPFYALNLSFQQTQNVATATEWLRLDLLDLRPAALFAMPAWFLLMVQLHTAR